MSRLAKDGQTVIQTGYAEPALSVTSLDDGFSSTSDRRRINRRIFAVRPAPDGHSPCNAMHHNDLHVPETAQLALSIGYLDSTHYAGNGLSTTGICTLAGVDDMDRIKPPQHQQHQRKHRRQHGLYRHHRPRPRIRAATHSH